MTNKPKSPVEDAAREHVNAEYWGDEKPLLSVCNTQEERTFIAGAKWLAGELMKVSYDVPNGWDDMDLYPVIEVAELKKLMGEE